MVMTYVLRHEIILSNTNCEIRLNKVIRNEVKEGSGERNCLLYLLVGHRGKGAVLIGRPKR